MPDKVKSRERLLLRRLLKKKTDPRAMARALSMRIDELAAWLNEPHVRQIIQGLSRLYDFDAQVNLKPSTLTRLAEMAAGDGQASETVRRACADLLKTPALSSTPPPAPQAETDDLTADRVHEIQLAIGAVGRFGLVAHRQLVPDGA